MTKLLDPGKCDVCELRKPTVCSECLLDARVDSRCEGADQARIGRQPGHGRERR
jgi:hypothetical protein